MKYYCHYTFWNKPDHIPWIMYALNRRLPEGSFVDFIFENPVDEYDGVKFIGKNEIAALFEKYKELYLKNFNVFCEISEEQYRMPNTNRAINRFLESDYDIFVTPQDDQKIQGCDFFDNTTNLYENEKNIGIVGCRSGFDNLSFTNFYSSSFSLQTENTKWLKSGEYQPVNLINDGPLIISKSTIERVGLFDVNMKVFYIEVDYSYSCMQAGLQNYVLGQEVVHEKFGRVIPSSVYEKELDYGRKDLDYLVKKHHL